MNYTSIGITTVSKEDSLWIYTINKLVCINYLQPNKTSSHFIFLLTKSNTIVYYHT